MFGIGIETNPATLGHRRPRITEARRRGHAAILIADRPGHVTGMVQRREHLASQLAGFIENRVDQII